MFLTVHVIELLRMCISFYEMSVNSVCMIFITYRYILVQHARPVGLVLFSEWTNKQTNAGRYRLTTYCQQLLILLSIRAIWSLIIYTRHFSVIRTNAEERKYCACKVSTVQRYGNSIIIITIVAVAVVVTA